MGHNHCKKKKSVGYYLTYEENALSISDDQDYLNKLQIFFLIVSPNLVFQETLIPNTNSRFF